MEQILQKIAQRIKQANKVAIFTHMRPDGDAIGSALALSAALDFLKIDNQVCVESEIPNNLAFIKGVEKIQKQPQGEFDLLILTDCSEEQRLGTLLDVYITAKRKKIDTINIDHHVSNTKFAKYNYVRSCAANCMNVFELIAYMGTPFDKNTAEYLMIGLLTDSGNFSHDDVTEETMSIAAKMVASGADICTLHYELFKKQSKQRAKLFSCVMQGIRYYHDDRFAAIVITQEMMQGCGADQSMTEGFVDFPLTVDGVEVAASLMEVKKRQYRVSLRSKKYADVNRIAGTFGGGGHVRAAGCMLFGELEEILDKLSYAVYQHLD